MKRKSNSFLQLVVFFVLMATFLTKTSCKKSELIAEEVIIENQQVLDKFFTLPNDATTTVKALAAQIKKQNDQYHFVEKLVKYNGYPNWSKIKGNNESSNFARSSNNDNTLLMLSFCMENNNVNTYLFCKQIGDSFDIRLNNKYNVINKINLLDSANGASNVAKLKVFAWFEKSINNQDSINVINCRIQRVKNTSLNFNSFAGKSTSGFADITICGYVWTQPTGWNTGLAPGQSGNYGSWTYKCDTYSVWVNGSGDEYLEENSPINNGGWWDGGSGGSTGGGSLSLIASELNNILKVGDSYSFQNIDPANAVIMNNVTEVQNYIDSIKTNTSFDTTKAPIIINQGDQKIENAQVILMTFPRAGVDIDVKLEKNSGVWDVLNVTSSDFGFTPTWSWEHKEFSISSTVFERTIILKGYVKYNIFIEGIGTVYKSKREYKLVVSKVTGKILSISQL
jgi:hypothetical protein